MFERIDSTIRAIRRQLLNDEELRKLLYNDSNNALDIDAPSIKDVEKYITNHPIYEFENKEDYTQHGMINIFMSNSEPDDEQVSVSAVIRINVVYNCDKWTLKDGSCRVLKMLDRIIALIDNKKLNVSNPVEYNTSDELILSKQLTGYALLFYITDGSAELENF